MAIEISHSDFPFQVKTLYHYCKSYYILKYDVGSLGGSVGCLPSAPVVIQYPGIGLCSAGSLSFPRVLL